MYYAIYDNQTAQLKSIGFNSDDKEMIKIELIDYLLLGNFSKEGEESIKKNTLEELCNYYEFTLIENEDIISEI